MKCKGCGVPVVPGPPGEWIKVPVAYFDPYCESTEVIEDHELSDLEKRRL